MIILLLFLVLYSIFHYKHAVFITASILLFFQNMNSGIQGVKMLYIICCILIFIYFFKRKNIRELSQYPKMLLIPCLFAGIGYLTSQYLGVMTNTLNIVLINILCYFVLPYVFYKSIENRDDIIYVICILMVFFSVVGLYAIIEALLHRNIITDFASTYGIIDAQYEGGVLGERFGFARCHSLLPYSSAMGMACATIFFLILYLKSHHVKLLPRLQTLLLLLMPFCVLLSATRSQYIVFAILCFPYLFWGKFVRTTTAKFCLVFVFIVLLFSGDFLFLILDSIFNSNKTQIGSSSDMREKQLEICISYFVQSPIWGYGKNYIWEFVRPYNPALYGAESVWFQLMVDYGIVGCITYFFICIFASVFLLKRSKILCFFPLAFLVGKTLSIVIGIELNFLLVFTIIFYKVYKYLVEEKSVIYEK